MYTPVKCVQASLHIYKYAFCQTHALELIANNGCQLGSRCSRQHNQAQVDLFFQLDWRGETEKKMAEEWLRESREERVGRREARVTTEGGKGHTLRQREATSKTMTASHTNHQRAYCSANYCTPQSQENDKNQHWMCLCWGNIRGTPLSFLISTFLFHFPFFLSPSLLSLFSYCKYCTVYALSSCKRTIIITASLLCGTHGKANCYGPIFSMELCK